MKMIKFTLLIAGLLAVTASAQLRLVQPPTLSANGSNGYTVSFELSEYADVAVSIVDPADSAIVRRLAAGVLGPKAGAPFTANSKVQSITWDGTDDLGAPVQNASTMVVRVRAGMSVKLAGYEGGNQYAFLTDAGFGSRLSSMVQDDNGFVFVQGMPGPLHNGHTNNYEETIRQYDKDGNYVKTVFPFPAGLSPSAVKKWGVIFNNDSTYSPKVTITTIPGITTTLLSSNVRYNSGNNIARLIPFGNTTELAYGTPYAALRFNNNGTISDSTCRKMISSPALPPSTSTQLLYGVPFYGTIPNSDYFYFSGVFYAKTLYGGLLSADTAATYRDGRIFKVNKTTGEAAIWLSVDNSLIPTEKAARSVRLGGSVNDAVFHGTAVDAKGRVYVCNRLNKKLEVYDSSAALLGSITLGYFPDNVVISQSTGVIYLATRQTNSGFGTWSPGTIKLYKFDSWDNGAAPLCSLTVTTSTHPSMTNYVNIVLNEKLTKPRIWIAYSSISVRIYDDMGTSFSLIKDFGAMTSKLTGGYSRIAVDRNNETVYINDNWYGLFKIDDWSNPVAKACKTSANVQLYGASIAISPTSEFYFRKATPAGSTGPLLRYTTGQYNNPAPFANTGANILTPSIQGKVGGGTGDGGIAISRFRDVAVFNIDMAKAGSRCISLYGDSGSSVTSVGKVLSYASAQSGGVKYDRDGNLYVGTKVSSPDHQIPSRYVGDWAYTTNVGAVLKIKRGDSAYLTPPTLYGVNKIYSQGLAPFSKDNAMGSCICYSPTFDVDPYGRLFIPNGITNRVAVVDNEGNDILSFGAYGNADNKTESPEIPLGMPVGVGVSEDYIYVTDYLNCRLARIQMVYSVDNMPHATTTLNEKALKIDKPIGIASRPNPANPHSTISLTLPQSGRIRLDVFDAAGSYLKTIYSGVVQSGNAEFVWDATNQQNKRVAAGIYFVRLLAGKQVNFHKVVIAK